MRTIKFRGKRLDNGEWVYGFYLETQMSGVFVLGSEIETKKRKDGITMRDKLWQHEVIPESVGQWTGIEGVYEGDIAKIFLYFYECGMQSRGYLESECKYEVVTFRDGAFYVGRTLLSNADYEIIGNIHDNPELMEVE